MQLTSLGIYAGSFTSKRNRRRSTGSSKASARDFMNVIRTPSSAHQVSLIEKTLTHSPGVVHTTTGAMLMLNTDLHIADLNKHMSRPDFVRNAMRAIQESTPTDGSSTPDLVRDDDSIFKAGPGSNPSVAPASVSARPKPPGATPNAPRSAFAPIVSPPAPPRSEMGSTMNPSSRTSSTTVSSVSFSKTWEQEGENALKVGPEAVLR